MQRANGSRVVSATPMLVQLAGGAPGVPPLQITVWPDWQGAPSEAHALQSVLVLAILAAHQTIATLANRLGALEVVAAEGERMRELTDTAARERSRARHSLALAAVQSVADQLEVTTTPIVRDDAVGSPASALDLLGAEDGPAPAAGGCTGVDDGGD